MRANNDELQLLQRAQKGDTAAFESLVNIHGDRLYNSILKAIGDRDQASDITQEVLLLAWRNIDKYDDRALFSTWLYRIGMNTVVSHVRREHALKRGGSQPAASLDHEHAAEPDRDARTQQRQLAPDEDLESREEEQRILQAIDSLDPDQRVVVILRDIDGLSYEEIAESLGLNPGTVRSRLFRAREQLRIKLADMLDA